MIPSLAFSIFSSGFSETSGAAQIHSDLAVIFGFVVAIVLIKAVSSWQRQKLWHETARLALEKGQPLPPDNSSFRYRARYLRRSMGPGKLAGGVTWIAVGLGLYLVNPPGIDRWWIIPVFIGIAHLISGLVYHLGGSDRPSPLDENADSTR
jgi:hypothetical protein